MPWKECSVVDERLRFVAQLLEASLIRKRGQILGDLQAPTLGGSRGGCGAPIQPH
jgi:hypothetical protein